MSEDNSEAGQEAVTTATNETPTVSAVIESRMTEKEDPAATLLRSLKRLEHTLRKSYPDPDRITVPVSTGMVIHHDFHRDLPPIPNYIMRPTPAMMNGKPLQISDVTMPEVRNNLGKVIRPAKVLPVYAAADADGSPMVDAKGDFVVIDPQSGRLRQRVSPRPVVATYVAPKRNWFIRKWYTLKAWIRSLRFR